ncbi:soluble NSF attachment protein 29-like [Scyliorhinus canicula]|uniref:soluble NSF attachment protein 29-like n=1 Tax=Scyliorhinus canicula TaxID=7830 RepID=UPI0018F4AC5C|nr:soluble NSF attachment protein 29-like [Scyliorhinus canicula]
MVVIPGCDRRKSRAETSRLENTEKHYRSAAEIRPERESLKGSLKAVMETRNRSKAEAKESPKVSTLKTSTAAGDKKEFTSKPPEPTHTPKKPAAEATAASEPKSTGDNSVTPPDSTSESKKTTGAQPEGQDNKEESSEGQPSNFFENMKPYILGGAAITALAVLVGVVFILHKK